MALVYDYNIIPCFDDCKICARERVINCTTGDFKPKENINTKKDEFNRV